MQRKDHLALGRFLLNHQMENGGLCRHRRAFLLGCIEPDYNLVTYMHGIRRYRNFRGHNAKNSFTHVAKCFRHIQSAGLRTARDYFILGTMLHYIADAFTWPHNHFWRKSLMEHVVYEKKLHQAFSLELKADREKNNQDISSLTCFYHDLHGKYSEAFHSLETDCRYIIKACKTLLAESLRCANSLAEEKFCQEKRVSYEICKDAS